ncbi:MAG: sensor histidine kinase [Desulfovibrionaceae bacterium]|nr:sensor histidine kinase [Desulfovibrionaceae bacterium]MBF0514155.1 sensor histidine kinase [Desulfovibrionaceae bacterium]
MDRDLAAIQAALRALSTSPSLAAGDLNAFRAQALELLRGYEGADIILADLDGRQLVNSFAGPGAPLPSRNIPAEAQLALKSGQPYISGLFKGAVTGRSLISVDVPVFREGRAVYDLSMTFPVDRFAAIFSRQHLSPQWVGTILDRDRVVVARTRDPQRYVGVRRGDSPLMSRIAETGEDTIENTTIDGPPSFASFCRSGESGWTVVINVPKTVIMADIWRWLFWTALGTSILSAAGIGLALKLAQNVEQVIQKQKENEALRDDIERITQHDLKSPLLSLIGGCEYLLDSPDLSAEQTKILAAMEKTGRRMLDSIDIYFNILTIENKKYQVRPAPVDAMHAIGRIWADFKDLSSRKNVNLTVSAHGVAVDSPKQHIIYADETLLFAMLYNLIRNAIEASPDNETIAVALGEADGFEIIAVRNQGSVPEQIRERMFEKYATYGKSAGTGLGAYSARLIAESHGGGVSLDASVAGQTTITVKLRKTAPD